MKVMKQEVTICKHKVNINMSVCGYVVHEKN